MLNKILLQKIDWFPSYGRISFRPKEIIKLFFTDEEKKEFCGLYSKIPYDLLTYEKNIRWISYFTHHFKDPIYHKDCIYYKKLSSKQA